MKETLWLKRIDLLLQFAALIIPLWMAVAADETGYLLVGILSCVGMQMFSCVVNFLLLKDRYVSEERPRYCFRLFIILLPLFLFGWIAFLVFVYFAIVLYAVLFLFAFFMMLWYFVITIQEILTIRRFIKRSQFI